MRVCCGIAGMLEQCPLGMVAECYSDMTLRSSALYENTVMQFDSHLTSSCKVTTISVEVSASCGEQTLTGHMQAEQSGKPMILWWAGGLLVCVLCVRMLQDLPGIITGRRENRSRSELKRRRLVRFVVIGSRSEEVALALTDLGIIA